MTGHQPGGFVLPHPPRDSRTLRHRVGPGRVRRLPDRAAAGARAVTSCCRRCAATTSSTPPSTACPTATAASRAAGGWSSCTADDIAALGLRSTATWSTSSPTGPTTTSCAAPRRSGSSSYDTPRGSAAAYYPETNPLVPLDSTALGSNTPTSKSVIVTLVPTGTATPGSSATGSDTMDATGDDDSHKSRPEPVHLS